MGPGKVSSIHVVLGCSGESGAAACAAVRRTAEGIPLEVTVSGDMSKAEPGPGWRAVPHAAGGFDALLRDVASRSGHRVVLVIGPGIVPQLGCIPALVAAIMGDGVGIAAARSFDAAGLVVEAGVDLWRDGTPSRYGERQDRRDPRWAPTREADTALCGMYAIRGDLLQDTAAALDRPWPWNMVELGLAARSRGLRVVSPAGAWTASTDARVLVSADIRGSEDRTELVEAFNGVLVERAEEAEQGTRDTWLGTLQRQPPAVLLLDRQIPRADRHAGDKRRADLLSALRMLGCGVTLVGVNGHRFEPYATFYETQGAEVVAPGDAGAALEWIARLAGERRELYRLIVVPWADLFEEWQQSLRGIFPNALLVYDSVDIEHRRLGGRLAVSADVTTAEVELSRAREIRVVTTADHTLTVSDDDQRTLLGLVPAAAVTTIPLAYDCGTSAVPAERQDLLFVGGFKHQPNVDAVLWFVAEVLPRLREKCEVRLRVVGADAPPELLELDRRDVEILGHVVDIASCFELARVFVAPIRYGAGVKGKVVQALAAGLPIVTTSIGAEGIRLADGVHGFIRDEPGEFAEAVVGLLEDDATWTRMSIEGMALAAREHSMEQVVSAMKSLVETAMTRSA